MQLILGVIVAGTVLIFGLVWLNESQATKIQAQAQAQATIIRAESDARFRDAQSTAIMVTAILPMVIVLVIGAGIVGLIITVAKSGTSLNRQPQIPLIERQIVYILPAGQPRRELWQALSNDVPSQLNLPSGARKDDTKAILVIR